MKDINKRLQDMLNAIEAIEVYGVANYEVSERRKNERRDYVQFGNSGRSGQQYPR